MSELIDENLITLAAVACLFPGARGAERINPATVFRWHAKGTRAPDGRTVRLECIRVGNRLLTSRQAVSRYVAALSAPPEATPVAPLRSPTARRSASDAAAAALIAAGA